MHRNYYRRNDTIKNIYRVACIVALATASYFTGVFDSSPNKPREEVKALEHLIETHPITTPKFIVKPEISLRTTYFQNEETDYSLRTIP